MTPQTWLLIAGGVTAWIWLARQIVSPHGFLDRCDCRKGAKCLRCIERDGLTK